MRKPIKIPSRFDGWKFCDYFTVVTYRAFSICTALAILAGLPFQSANKIVADLFGYMNLSCPSGWWLFGVGIILLALGGLSCVLEEMKR